MKMLAWMLAVILLLMGVAAIVMVSVSLSDNTAMPVLNPQGMTVLSGESGNLASAAAVIMIAAITAIGAVAARQRSRN